MDTTLTYVGGETFILYDIARCEIHLYLEADETGRVLRLYWFQFEGYLPSFIPRSYDYTDEPFRTTIGQHEFFDGVSYYHVADSRKDWSDDSDITHVLRLFEQKGYHLDDEITGIRLVRLDENEKQELMLIYLEDLAQYGLSIASFEDPGGDLKWKAAYEELRNRTLSGMQIDMK